MIRKLRGATKKVANYMLKRKQFQFLDLSHIINLVLKLILNLIWEWWSQGEPTRCITSVQTNLKTKLY